MVSFKERMAQKTSGVRAVADIQASGKKTDMQATAQTAPGMLGALADANLRIQELEKQAERSLSLPVAHITANPWQPRKEFDPEQLDELCCSIQELGLMQPIVVRKHPSQDGHYQIVVGERRFRAHQQLGKAEIKGLVADLSDAEMAVWAMGENMTRSDLSDYEIAKAARTIEQEFPTRKALADALGKSRQHLYRYFAFDKLPQNIRDDLDSRPRLLSCTVAGKIATQLTVLGAPGEAILQSLWQELKREEVDSSRIPGLMESRLKKDQPVATEQAVQPVYSAGVKAGQVKKDAKSFTISIQTKFLSQEQEQALRDAVSRVFAG